MKNPQCRLAAAAMSDTNQMLRGKMALVKALESTFAEGRANDPAQQTPDPTDMPCVDLGVTNDSGNFHDRMLIADPSTVPKLPRLRPGRDLLLS